MGDPHAPAHARPWNQPSRLARCRRPEGPFRDSSPTPHRRPRPTAGSALDPETVRWFPDRAWGGRVYVPASGRAAEATTGEDGESVLAEYYGWVSFAPAADDDDQAPADLRAKVDFTDVTAEDNPDWRIDIN